MVYRVFTTLYTISLICISIYGLQAHAIQTYHPLVSFMTLCVMGFATVSFTEMIQKWQILADKIARSRHAKG